MMDLYEIRDRHGIGALQDILDDVGANLVRDEAKTCELKYA